MDSGVLRPESAAVRETDHHAATVWTTSCLQGPSVESSAGRPGAAGCRVLSDEPDLAAAGSLVRDLEVVRGPDREAARALARAAAAEPLSQRHGADRGRHPGADTGPQRGRAVQELPLLDQPPGRHRRRLPPCRLCRPARARQPQRLQGMGTVRSQELGRGNTTVIADGGYRGTGLIIPHRREPGQTELPAWKEAHNASHRKVRARVEHTFARMKSWKILRDCRLKGDGVHHAMLGIARLHNLALTG